MDFVKGKLRLGLRISGELSEGQNHGGSRKAIPEKWCWALAFEMAMPLGHFAGMRNLTIREIPNELYAELKRQALKNRRNLSQEVIAVLGRVNTASGNSSVDETERKRRRAEEMIAIVETMRNGMTRFANAGEIDEAKRFGRR